MEWPYHKYDEDRKKILCGGGGGREEGSRSPPRNARRGRVTIGSPKGGDDPKGGGGGGIGEDGLATIGVTAASVDVTYAIAGFGVAWCVRLVPIRPRSRCELHSLRTFPVVTLHPRFVSIRFDSVSIRFCFDSIRFDSPLHHDDHTMCHVSESYRI
jgi:hypothetical protein